MKKVMRRIGFLVALVLAMTSSRAAPLPIEAMLATPETANFKLSPDGAKIAFLRRAKNRMELCIYDVETKRITVASRLARSVDDDRRFDQAFWFAWAPPQQLIVAGFRDEVQPPMPRVEWPLTEEPRIPSPYLHSLGDDRLLFVLSGGFAFSVVNGLTGAWSSLEGWPREAWEMRSDREYRPWQMDRMVSPSYSADTVFIPRTRNSPRGPGNVYRVNLATGKSALAGKEPALTGEWLLGADGSPRIVAVKEGSGLVLHKYGEDGKWSRGAVLGSGDEVPIVHGLSPAGDALIATRRGSDGREQLAEYDIIARAWREPLAVDARYDLESGFVNLFDGASRASPLMYGGNKITGPLFSPASRRLLGVRYFAEGYRQQWFDPQITAFQQSIDNALPVTSNAILDMSESGERALVFSWSGRDPGFYSIADRTKQSVSAIAVRIPGVVPTDMGAVSSHQIQARDGTILDAYLTIPPGSESKALPLVVVVGERLHRREIGAFTPLVQILATRGLAVLQVNHRGVVGYGQKFALQGRDPSQTLLHEDIEDAVHWAIREKVADSERVAILGEGFGGFVALYALGHSPGLYRCGVGISPISDWTFRYAGSSLSNEQRFSELFGYGKAGVRDDILRAKSPSFFADKIKVPLLLAYSRLDRHSRVQGPAMEAALKKAKAAADVLYFNEDESRSPVLSYSAAPRDETARTTESMVQFLSKHLRLEPVEAGK